MSRLEDIAKQFKTDGLPLTFPVAQMILRKLSGFAGYPQEIGGENFMIDRFREVCVSVEHAEEIVMRFDEKFPTLRELRDTARGLRPQFEKSPDWKAAWKAKHGEPEPFHYEPVSARSPDEITLQNLIAINHAIAERLEVPFKELQRVSWNRYFSAWRDLGFPLTGAQREFL